MPTPNVQRLNGMLDHIRRFPRQHKQDIWRCRTAMCAAGHSLMEAGVDNWIAPIRDNETLEERMFFERWADALSPLPEEEGTGDVCELGDIRYVRAADRAQRILGLTNEQAEELFDADNSLKDLERIVREIITEAASQE